MRVRLIVVGAVVVALSMLVAACSDDDGTVPPPTTSETTSSTTSTSTPTSDPSVPSTSVTLDAVLERNALRCGVGNRPGFAEQVGGDYRGFDADFCRVIAAVVLGDADRVEFVDASMSPNEALELLGRHEFDVLIRVTTQKLTRDALGVDFGPIIFYDGQAVMAGRDDVFSEESGLDDLDGFDICVGGETSSSGNLEAHKAATGATYELVKFDKTPEAIEEFRSGRCRLVTADWGALQAERTTEVIFRLGEFRDPLAPVYRDTDPRWADLVNWSIYGVIIAEEYGLTSEDVAEAREQIATLPVELQKLLDSGELADALGLPREGASLADAVEQVGNYGEIYENNLRALGFERAGSLNALWRDNGLIYAPPAS